MTGILIVWSLVTGSLFTWSCDSPLNRDKAECKAHKEWKQEYDQRVWGINK